MIDYSKNDCYAMGVVLYEMLVGECTLSNSAQFVDISTCYSASIRDLVDSLLQADPKKRPGPEYLQGLMLSLGFEDWV